MAKQIIDRFLEHFWVVVEQANSSIAVLTQQPTHFVGVVAMVNSKLFCFTLLFVTADGANAILLLQYFVVCFQCDIKVPSKLPAFLFVKMRLSVFSHALEILIPMAIMRSHPLCLDLLRVALLPLPGCRLATCFAV